ncbi:MAG: pilus assembly protein, partial [Methylocystis sp.]|nr:pilus assembly protein [Methylocystis sp.]
ITGGAKVTLSPGEYVVKDGPLVVDGMSTFNAVNAGIYLTGAGATFKFAADSSVSMTAPTSGPLAGILFFEDRAAPALQQHEILSNDAKMLLGTIYLPRGRLRVEANKAIAQDSAFTIIIAQRMELFGGPNLVLNSDYDKTNVPIPGGLNPGYSYLAK